MRTKPQEILPKPHTPSVHTRQVSFIFVSSSLSHLSSVCSVMAVTAMRYGLCAISSAAIA